MARVLVVDDDALIRSLLQEALASDGHQILLAAGGAEALDQAHRADVVVLDLGMPELSGYEVMQILRQNWPLLPILILTGTDSEDERVLGLRQGADDYMGKPVRLKELRARIEALLRRAGHLRRIEVGELSLEPTQQQALLRGEPLSLTTTEFELLYMLARYTGRVLSRTVLFHQVWGDNPELSERIVDTYIHRLRENLGDDPKNPRYLETVFGRGYRMKS